MQESKVNPVAEFPKDRSAKAAVKNPPISLGFDLYSEWVRTYYKAVTRAKIDDTFDLSAALRNGAGRSSRVKVWDPNDIP